MDRINKDMHDRIKLARMAVKLDCPIVVRTIEAYEHHLCGWEQAMMSAVAALMEQNASLTKIALEARAHQAPRPILLVKDTSETPPGSGRIER